MGVNERNLGFGDVGRIAGDEVKISAIVSEDLFFMIKCGFPLYGIS